MPITLDGTNGITTPTYGGADTSEYLVPVTQFKNRIINGAMVIDQRNAGASVTITSASASQYVLDRWYLRAESSTGSKVSVQRSTTAPAGFINSQLITSLSAYTLGASEHFGTIQAIEGFNVADLGWGTANAKPITISFKVRSSLTGTFGGFILNSAANRCYVFSYTINSANTFEDKTVTIAGDTSGTWLTDNGVGLFLSFSVGAGSSTTGTAGSWGSTLFRSVTGQTSLVGTNGATFYITGVQLEVGSTATSFDYRPFGTELQLCQRYCVVFTGLGGGARFGSGYYNSSTTAFNTVVPIGVPLRASPTVTASDMTIGIQGAAPTISSISGISYAVNIPSVNFISNTGTGTDGAFGQMRVNATTSSLTISAEL